MNDTYMYTPTHHHTHPLSQTHTFWVFLWGGKAAVLFHCISLCFMQPLPHQACLVLLRQEICSPALCYRTWCMYVCIRSQVKQLPTTDMLLFAWHAWTNGLIVCFEFRSSRWAAPHLIKWVRVVIHMFSTRPFFFMTTNQKYWSSQPHTHLICRGKILQEFYTTAGQLKLKWEIQGQVDLG